MTALFFVQEKSLILGGPSTKHILPLTKASGISFRVVVLTSSPTELFAATHSSLNVIGACVFSSLFIQGALQKQ
jgi:hypothetical protein